MPRWLVDAAHAGMRLDRFVTSKVPEGAVTNGLLQRFIRRRQMVRTNVVLALFIVMLTDAAAVRA